MNILFENSDYLILNKPAGLVVHPDGRTQEGSVTGWLAENYPQLKGIGGTMNFPQGVSIERYGVVHRIDRETSGILVVAKTSESYMDLQLQFQDHKIKKLYHVFVYGNIKGEKGIIDLPIGRSARDFRRKSAERGARGTMRDALTHYKVLTHADTYCFLEAEPKTGRTHQIRVHFKSIQHPIVADKLYAENMLPILGFTRLALHARFISFTDLDGKELAFEAPYPEDFIKAIEMTKKVAK